MKTVLNVKTDVEIKERAQALAKHLGVPLSTIVNAYLKEFVRSGEFRVMREPELAPHVAARIRTHVAEVQGGKNVSPGFSNIDDARDWLLS